MSVELSQKEQATNYETMRHIRQVGIFLHRFAKMLLDRADQHDQSKLYPPEVQLFAEYTNKLADCTYGSEEYNDYLKALEPALIHHYAKNRHHPEHFPDGIIGMNLVDLVEMICDWKAATMRHHDGNLLKSIHQNCIRFGLSNDIKNILFNTAELFDSEDNQ